MSELLGSRNPLNIELNVQLLVPYQLPLSIHCAVKHKRSSPRRSLPLLVCGFSRFLYNLNALTGFKELQFCRLSGSFLLLGWEQCSLVTFYIPSGSGSQYSFFYQV